MTHPLQRLSPPTQKRTLLILAAMALVVMGVFRIIDRPLQTAAAPVGIVSFELAGTLDAAQAIIASWDRQAQLLAAFGLGLDYLFMPLYATAIALACVVAASGPLRSRRLLVTVGLLLAWGAWFAALFDAVENYALLRVLLGSETPAWPALAAWCASLKFLLILAGLAYMFIGGVAYFVQAARARPRRAGANR
jgi:hypothetical protein